MSDQTPLDENIPFVPKASDVAPSFESILPGPSEESFPEAPGADSPLGEEAPDEQSTVSDDTSVATAAETAPGISDSPPPATDDAETGAGDPGPTAVADPIGVVRPGDSTSLAALVMSLVEVPGSTYDGEGVHRVKVLQEGYDLPATGEVSGLTWAYLLPSIDPSEYQYRSLQAQILASLVGQNGKLWVDDEILDAVELSTGVRSIDEDTWGILIEKALNPMLVLNIED